MIAQINGLKINYQEAGRGEAIIFVHGWGGKIASLKKLYSLAAKKYHALILDLPGFGQTTNPPPHWGTKEYAGLIINLLDKLMIKQINYFGHSFGGGLGIYIASHYPQRIKHLILSGAAFRRKDAINRVSTNRPSVPTAIANRLPVFIKKILYRIFFPQSDLMRHPHLQSNFKKIIREDLTDTAKKISQPTLIFWGKNDRDTPINQAYQLKKLIKNSTLKVFSQMSHNLPIKKPKTVFKYLDKFIKG